MDLRTKIVRAFESLENMRRQLEQRLDQIDDRVLSIPEGDGKWSVNQVLAHLSNAEFGSLRYIRRKMQGIGSLGNSNIWSVIRFRLLKWSLDAPLRYKMPGQLPQPSNEMSFNELKVQFDKNRQAISELILSFPEESLDKLIFKHPFAGRFSLHQTIHFMEDHYNHHLKQIDRILKSVENRGKSVV